MKFEFLHREDYDLIIPPILKLFNNDFRALVSKFFPPEKGELIFCLMEKVTLSEIGAIGETIMFSKYSGNEAERIISQYETIVDDVQKEKNLVIAYHKDWYRYQSFILIGENNIQEHEFTNPFPKPDWEQGESDKKKKKKENYGESALPLPEGKIKDYLEYYAQRLHSDFAFSQYPHYCIIVRPIAVIENTDIIPLGNIFLHFGTVNKKDEQFYLKLVTEFIYVWFTRKGVRIIREIERQAVEVSEGDKKKEEEKLKTLQNYYRPKKLPATKERLTIIKNYLIRANIKHKDKIEADKKIILEKFIPFLLFDQQYLNENHTISWDTFSEFWTIGIPNNITGTNVETSKWLKAIAGRHIAMIMHIFFKYSINFIHKKYSTRDESGKEGPYAYFRTNLFLNIHKEVNQNTNVQAKWYENASDAERDFLKLCRKRIQELIPENQIERFEKTSLLKITLPNSNSHPNSENKLG